MKYRLILLGCCLLAASLARADQRPNIVWIIPDDMSANFSCYGENAVETPHVDRLAAAGVKFTNAYVTAPVCSTCRSAFITGMYQTSLGAHHHRSGRGDKKIHLPKRFKLVPKLFQDAGYFTSITSWPGKKGRLGKTDYNFEWDQSVYDGSDWSARKKGQPFFAQIHTPGGKLRGKDASGWEKVSTAAEQKLGGRVGIDAVSLPPYYPQHPDVLRDWAAYLDSVRLTDAMVGEVLARLDKEGVRENTLVLFMTDHGISHARGKQFMYDEGLHVPLVVAGPGIKAGTVRDDVVEHIDIAALSLAAAGIAIPKHMHARNILAVDYVPRETVFAARDRCDETIDHMRSARTKNFKYIRNFLPNRPYLQPCAYKDAKAILIALREWNRAGKLDEVQQLLFRETRPPEELYDVRNDPHVINNLASDPNHADKLKELRGRLDAWMVDTNDQGRAPESDAMYDSDMATYLEALKRKGLPSRLKIIKDNIALMKKWRAEERVWGNWALTMPNGAAGWLSLSAPDAQPRGELWTVGGGKQLSDVTVNGDQLTFARGVRIGKPEYKGSPPTGGRVACKHTATVQGDVIRLVMERPLPDGKIEKVTFSGKRMPPLPAKPDLGKVTFGKPIELFNGRNLDGWRLTDPKQINGWKAIDGELVNTTPKLDFSPYSRYGNLRTDREFMVFHLKIEFKVPPGGNSGVYLRGVYEAQVLDRDSKMQGIQGVGAIFGRIKPSLNAGKLGNQWQAYDVTLVDRHVTVILNGKKVIDNQPLPGCTNGALQADETIPGPLYLQGDHTAVRYRNIILRPVLKSSEETNAQ
ncbi:MAG: sulfatase-like hydrolase/transferase, partial [Planctomycetales bacterium]